jgi:hypothetical protein
LNEIGEDVHGELDVGGVIKEVLGTVRSSRMALTVLRSGCAMQIDEDTESILFGPIDGSDDSSPRVDIGGSDRLEWCTLTVGGTEGPISDWQSDSVDT